MDMTGVYACLFEAVCDVTTVPSHLNRFFVDGKQINTRETAARIVLVDDIFRAMTRQV